jgi:hypothetical protein
MLCLLKCVWMVQLPTCWIVWGGGVVMVPVVSSDDVPGWSAAGVGVLRGLFSAGSAAASGS